MRWTIRSRSVSIDPWLEDFVKRTLGFAVWNYSQDVDTIAVALTCRGEAEFCCDVRVQSSGHLIALSATAPEIFEAVQLARERLEIAVSERGALPATEPDQSRIAA